MADYDVVLEHVDKTFDGDVRAVIDYNAEISRVRALEHGREIAEAENAELDLKVRHLERTGQNLKLERTALDEERIRVLNEMEEMRLGNLELQEALVAEKEIRREREQEIADIAGTYKELVDELEQEIEAGEQEVEQLGWLSADPSLVRDGEGRRELELRRRAARERLDELYGEWERLSGELDALAQTDLP